MNQLEPKPGIYIRIKKREKEFPSIIKIFKLLQKGELLSPRNLLWWDIIELRIDKLSPNSPRLVGSGKILDDYLLTGCRIARINCIFRFKMEIEYEKS